MEGLLLYTTLMMAAGSLVMAVYWLVARPASAVEDRLREINPRLSEEPVAEPVSEVLVRRIAKPLAEKVPVSPRNVRRLRRRLMRAGFYSENAVMIYQAIRLASVILLPLLVFFFMTAVLRRPVDMTTLGLTIVAVGYGAFMPIFILSRMITKRQHRIRKALPDALDLMVVCVEAGLGLNACAQPRRSRDGFGRTGAGRGVDHHQPRDSRRSCT
jgi:tight adherence protein C